jgi:sec-independent protein translocase protein TatA
MGDLFTAPHLIFLGILAVLLFGGKKLPELGKGLGEGLRGFKDGMKGLSDEDAVANRKREELEAAAYQEAKMAAEAKAHAEARVAAEQKAAREGEVVIK